MKQWKKGIASWQACDVLYLSIPFTWLVNEAISIIKKSKNKVIVGGPGAILLRDRFDGLAEVQEDASPFEPIIYHNPFATFTTRGCPNKCPFCAVPKIEGKFREILDFTPRPIICDNNFLASSKKHFDRVIDKIKIFPYVDFNQGLEARLFTSRIADRFSELKRVKIRFAFDKLSDEKYVVDAINLAKKKGLKDIACYLLFGFKDSPEDAFYRAELLHSMKVQIYPMRFQSLNAERRNCYVPKDKKWTEYGIIKFRAYWANDRYAYHFPFDEFKNRKERPVGFGFINDED